MEGTDSLIGYGDLLARFCLSFVFLWSGVSKAFHPAAGRAEVAALGLPIRRCCCRSPSLARSAGA
jgi:uncharacterized membrane protein YphA (DoxX/SURF4 family)